MTPPRLVSGLGDSKLKLVPIIAVRCTVGGPEHTLQLYENRVILVLGDTFEVGPYLPP